MMQLQPDLCNRQLEWVFSGSGPLARKMGYKVRPGQIQMARACAQAFAQQEVLITEAGTGIGKTFAYLVPALLSDQVTVISVHSKALQDQLFSQDLPELLGMLGRQLRLCLLKGLENYLCLKKYYDAMRSGGLGTLYDDRRLSSFVEAALTAAAEDRADSAPGDISLARQTALLRNFAYSKYHCRWRTCPYFISGQCFAYAARRRAAGSQLVIVNHALLLQALAQGDHLREQPGILPRFANLIVDECHRLRDAGRSVYTQCYSTRQVNRAGSEFLSQLTRSAPDLCPYFEPELQALHAAQQQLIRYLSGQAVTAVSLPALKYCNYQADDPAPPTVNETFMALMTALAEQMLRLLALCSAHAGRELEALQSFAAALSEQHASLVRALYNDRDDQLALQDSDEVAYAVLRTESLSVNCTPIFIGERFGAQIAELNCERQVGIVMTSATIAVGQDFTRFIAETLGDALSPATLLVPTSFDYRHQTRLLVSESFPSPDAGDRVRRLLEQLYGIIEIVKGGILFLATSHRAVQEAGQALEARFSGRRLVLWQNMPGLPSVHDLLMQFRGNGHAILAGTAALWEGVDVPGRALSLVIIDRLPFGNPADPIFQAQSEKLAAACGRDCSFARILLPEAIIRLRQGVGRLMRHEADRGAVIIGDPRLTSRSYRHAFYRALPEMGCCNNLSELKSFLQSL